MRIYYRDLNGVLFESPQLVEPGKGRNGPHSVPGAPDRKEYARTEYTYDLDLGQDHWLCWNVGSTGQVVGGSIMHRTPKTETGWCEGAFNVAAEGYGTVSWEWNGDLERPTVRASLLCGCGDHGYITAGRSIECCQRAHGIMVKDPSPSTLGYRRKHGIAVPIGSRREPPR